MKGAASNGYPNLEFLRFAAALAVVVYHYQHFKSAPGWRYKHVVDDQPFEPGATFENDVDRRVCNAIADDCRMRSTSMGAFEH